MRERLAKTGIRGKRDEREVEEKGRNNIVREDGEDRGSIWDAE